MDDPIELRRERRAIASATTSCSSNRAPRGRHESGGRAAHSVEATATHRTLAVGSRRATHSPVCVPGGESSSDRSARPTPGRAGAKPPAPLAAPSGADG